MKPFKYLLALPLALTSLVACGGNTYSKINYKTAVKTADSYLPSIKNHKASAIAISGHVNTIKIKGDCTFWSYSSPLEDFDIDDIKPDETLLTLIPNFSVKDSEIVVDPQEIATTSIPAALVSSLDSVTTDVVSKEIMLYMLLNLPKFPINRNMIKAFSGFTGLGQDEDGNLDWEHATQKDWEHATVTFGKSNSGLKITISTEDVMSFVEEVMTALAGGSNELTADSETTEQYPLDITITTNNVGYINYLAVKTEIKEIEKKFEEPDIVYFSINGDLEADFALRFKQTFSKPISLKYQLKVYEDIEQGDIPSVVWFDNSEVARPLKLKETKPLTTDLDTFKDYVTFDWFKNIEKGKKAVKGGKESEQLILKKKYDDPVFIFNYWEERGYNIAFANSNYDVLVLPAYNASAKKDSCQILGAYAVENNPINESLVTTSIDGKIISTKTGLPKDATEKILEAAGDGLQDVFRDQTLTSLSSMDEIFINSNMLNSGSSEYIINIAVAINK